MGKPTGFIEWPRAISPQRATGERLADYREVELPQTPELARKQAGRCMDCGIPFCHQGCPLGNLIPDFNDAVYRDDLKAAYRQLIATNNFPEFTGRLCPAPCESACTLAYNREAVTIEETEKRIIEHAFREGWVVAESPLSRSGRTVAVVGSGPAGLAAAEQLNRVGHDVTVFERADRAGGLLRYGIPDFKLEKHVIDRRLALMEAEGISFELGVEVGQEQLGWRTLRERYDAVLVAIGAGVPRDLPVPGRELQGVVMALDFLEHNNRVVAGIDTPRASLHAEGKRVVILGGGDTGSDCVGTSLRHGAASVRQIELFPQPPLARLDSNPWPQWPMILRTSTSHQEGGSREYGVMTKRLSGDGKQLKELHGVGVELVDGRLEELVASDVSLEVDLLILAMGFVSPLATTLVDQLEVALDKRGNVAADAQYASSVEGVFVAGDAHRGQSLVVWAIHEGREAAHHIDAFLREGPSPLPLRGVDSGFGGR